MSITPKQWSEKDEAGTIPDATLRYETYFNTADGYLYRVCDFLLVQEPGTEGPVYPETRKGEESRPSYIGVTPGAERWYIVLEKNDDLGPRKAFRYDDFKDSLDNGFHRVKNDKPKTQYRSLPEEAVRGGPRHHVIDNRRRAAEPRMGTLETVRTHSSISRSVDMGQGHSDVEGVDWEIGPDGQRKAIDH